jgi:hypothetical protein
MNDTRGTYSSLRSYSAVYHLFPPFKQIHTTLVLDKKNT